ncbi:MAG: YciI family protein [Acidimicrobiales bacterium]|nr:YciI family protein [Acidimicrobiales bacterium]
MHFVIHALDRIDAGDLRAQNRSEHLSYLDSFNITFGGPMLTEAGGMCGSLIVIETENLDAAEAFAAGDPYAKAGLFDLVTIKAMRPVIGI